jgi:GT2 family glycosyltransferase
MARVDARPSEIDRGAERTSVPAVLVILVARDGATWLPQCLLGLSRQTHPRIGVLAVDSGSSDGSQEVLESALGPEHVVRLDGTAGFSGAVGEALRTEVARQADYLLLLHDDTVLAPDAVAKLVEAAEGVAGSGVVGPKVLDWDDPRMIREIGMSTDRFGYPYSPLEEGEIDHGQYDQIRRVQFVSSCAMLISRDAWTRVGPPDARLDLSSEDLDFCWRAQVAGFHVLMAPDAVAHHRGASGRGERTDVLPRGRARYDRERVALASILKNYAVLSLVWILPLYLVQGMARVAALLASRRFEDAGMVLAAWGWNVVHLPATLRLRIRAQAVRAVPDRSVRRSMAPAGIQLRRWTSSAADALLPRRPDAGEDELDSPIARGRVLRIAAAHPVATAWVVAVILALIAYRHLLSASPLTGGALARFPSSPIAFFRELVSGVRSTGLGGTQPASPALGLLGLGSVVALGSPALLQRLLLMLLPVGAGAGCYRTVRSLTGERVSAVVAGGVYALSGATLWAFSEGRLPELVFLAGLPWLAGKVWFAFDWPRRVRPLRWVVGGGLGLAVLGSFLPSVLLATAVLALSAAAVSRGRRAVAGLGRIATMLGVAAALALPVTIAVVRAGSASLSDQAGTASFASLLRLSLSQAGGTWPTAFFAPVAAAAGLLFVAGPILRPAVRATASAVAGLYLAWLSAAGQLPGAVSNAPTYLGVAALGMSVVIGLGLASVLPGVARQSFGLRQLGAAVMTTILAVGLGGQVLLVARGDWQMGERRNPPAYAVIDQPTSLPYLVLWIGRAGGEPLPAPGGPPVGTARAGRASVGFSVTGAGGASALDTGRPVAGKGYEQLRLALTQILAGDTRHGGALLAPFGIRYVVADPDLAAAATRGLARQLDLDALPAEGLLILINAKAPPRASLVETPGWIRPAGKADPVGPEVEALPVPTATTLDGGGEVYRGSGTTDRSLVLIASQFDGRWRLVPEGKSPLAPFEAFGWATGFRVPADTSTFSVRFGGQRARTAAVALLAALWAAGLWMTRRPARNG